MGGGLNGKWSSLELLFYYVYVPPVLDSIRASPTASPTKLGPLRVGVEHFVKPRRRVSSRSVEDGPGAGRPLSSTQFKPKPTLETPENTSQAEKKILQTMASGIPTVLGCRNRITGCWYLFGLLGPYIHSALADCGPRRQTTLEPRGTADLALSRYQPSS